MEQFVLCPECGKLSAWNSYFQGWYCTSCGYLKKRETKDSGNATDNVNKTSE